MSDNETGAAAVEFRSVTKVFKTGKQQHIALDGIDLRIERGEIFGVIGYSGAGKSTLVRLINALEKPTDGTVLISGDPITGVPESRVRHLRRDIGMIFQQFNLFRSRTAAGNIEYPLKVAGWPRARRKARVAELLEFVGLSDKARSYPDQLSGGQKQRVGIARALATSPSLLLADEATSALDPETTGEVLRLLKKINRELGVTIVVITHEMDVIRAVADRVAVLAAGRIVELADTFDVFSAPMATPTRSFVETVLHNRPTTGELERLGERHPGRLVTVDIDDERGIGAELAAAVTAGVSFEVVFGGVSTLQDKTFGSLTLALNGPDQEVSRFAERLAAHDAAARGAEALIAAAPVVAEIADSPAAEGVLSAGVPAAGETPTRAAELEPAGHAVAAVGASDAGVVADSVSAETDSSSRSVAQEPTRTLLGGTAPQRAAAGRGEPAAPIAGDTRTVDSAAEGAQSEVQEGAVPRPAGEVRSA
ncbi:ATP-binding cassette domain-containing protein [Nocardia sp. ET3-3]|uniref:ATP-binding cassette domain-containing protein n=1 Tax=Nocardia terrae TaxID=2675851 RepID=A0A7K1V6J1_9NOCA|nr:ATP-binding cassette domain-containing protein [Nocardia terrae]